ncbi:MAG: hypothetical protein HZA35_03095 [Parcubacteria group bacterium]|nr:hypothetical protein [Parcubacteria group bacterium]
MNREGLQKINNKVVSSGDVVPDNDGRDFLWNNVDSTFSERIREVRTFDELIAAIVESRFSVKNEHKGNDHPEHLIKRIEMARLFHYVEIIPPGLELRKKVATWMKQDGIVLEDHVSLDAYKNYLAHKLSILTTALSDEELGTIAQKISPDIFATIDTPLERTMLLLNALAGVQTRFSCAGHVRDLKSDLGLYSGYISINGMPDELVKQIKAIFSDKNFFVEWESGNVLRFYQIPNETYCKEKGYPSTEEVLLLGKHKIEALFGGEVFSWWPLNAQELFSSHYSFRVELQKMLQHFMETKKIAQSEYKALFDVTDDLEPGKLIRGVYGDYFHSHEAEAARDRYIKKLEEVLIRYRESLTNAL